MKHIIDQEGIKYVLIYVCGTIIVLQIFAHIMLIIFAIKSYKFEKSIWFLLPILNAKYNHKLLDLHKDEKDDNHNYNIRLYDRYNMDNNNNITATTTTIKSAVDIYESFCYQHIVSNHLYQNLGYDIGAMIMSYLGDDISNDNDDNHYTQNNDTIKIDQRNIVDI